MIFFVKFKIQSLNTPRAGACLVHVPPLLDSKHVLECKVMEQSENSKEVLDKQNLDKSINEQSP